MPLKIIPQVAKSLYGYIVPRMKILADSKHLKVLVVDFFILLKVKDKVIQITQDAVAVSGRYEDGKWVGYSDGTLVEVPQTAEEKAVNGTLYIAKHLIIAGNKEFGPIATASGDYSFVYSPSRYFTNNTFTPKKYGGTARLHSTVEPQTSLPVVDVPYAEIVEQRLLTITAWPAEYSTYAYKTYVHYQLFDLSPNLAKAKTHLFPVAPLSDFYPALTPRGYLFQTVSGDLDTGWTTQFTGVSYTARVDFIGRGGVAYRTDRYRNTPAVARLVLYPRLFVRTSVGAGSIYKVIAAHTDIDKAELSTLDVVAALVDLGYDADTLGITYSTNDVYLAVMQLGETTAISRTIIIVGGIKNGLSAFEVFSVEFKAVVADDSISVTPTFRTIYTSGNIHSLYHIPPAFITYETMAGATTVSWYTEDTISSPYTRTSSFVVMDDTPTGTTVTTTPYVYLDDEVASYEATRDRGEDYEEYYSILAYKYNSGGYPSKGYILRGGFYVPTDPTENDYDFTDPDTGDGIAYYTFVNYKEEYFSYGEVGADTKLLVKNISDTLEVYVYIANNANMYDNPYYSSDLRKSFTQYFFPSITSGNNPAGTCYGPSSHGIDIYYMVSYSTFSYSTGINTVTYIAIKGDQVVPLGTSTVEILEGTDFNHEPGDDFPGHALPDIPIPQSFFAVTPRYAYLTMPSNITAYLGTIEDPDNPGEYKSNYELVTDGVRVCTLDKDGNVNVLFTFDINQEPDMYVLSTPSEDIIITQSYPTDDTNIINVYSGSTLLFSYSQDFELPSSTGFPYPYYDAKHNRIIFGNRSIHYVKSGDAYVWELHNDIEQVVYFPEKGLLQVAITRWDFSSFALSSIGMTHVTEAEWISELESATGHEYIRA